MKLLPYFRWYPADAESDAKYSAMNIAELGLFHRCLNHSWVNNGIPPDVAELARVLRVPEKEVVKSWPRVSVCFVKGAALDRLVNARQEEERSYAVAKSERATNSVRTRYERSTDDSLRAYESESVSDSESVLLKKNATENGSWFNDEFWPLWPVKDNKHGAKIAARKLSDGDKSAAVEGLKLQAAKILAMERPIHAATWLNGRRWEDETKVAVARATSNGNGTLFPDRNQTRREETVIMTKILRGEKPNVRTV